MAKAGIELQIKAEGVQVLDVVDTKLAAVAAETDRYVAAANTASIRAEHLTAVHSQLITKLGSEDAATSALAGKINALSSEMQSLGVKGSPAFEKLATSAGELDRRAVSMGMRFEDTGKSLGSFVGGLASAEKGTLSLGTVVTGSLGQLDNLKDRLEQAKASGVSAGEAFKGVAAGGLAAFVASFAVPKIIEAGNAIHELVQENHALAESTANATAYNQKQDDQFRMLAARIGETAETLRAKGITSLREFIEVAHLSGEGTNRYRDALEGVKKEAAEAAGLTKTAAVASAEHSQAMRSEAAMIDACVEANKRLVVESKRASDEQAKLDRHARAVADAAKLQRAEVDELTKAHERMNAEQRKRNTENAERGQKEWIDGVGGGSRTQATTDALNSMRLTRSATTDPTLAVDPRSSAVQRALARLAAIDDPNAQAAAEGLRGGNASALREAAELLATNARNFLAANVDAATTRYGVQMREDSFALQQILRELTASAGRESGAGNAGAGGEAGGERHTGGFSGAATSKDLDAHATRLEKAVEKLSSRPTVVQIDGREVARAVNGFNSRHEVTEAG